MTAYFEYLREMFLRVLADVGIFFRKVFADPWPDLPENFNFYNSTLQAHSGGFGFLGWFFYVLFLLLLIALIGGVGFLLVVFIRKYIRFVKRELDK